ncbi:MAG TPA: DUF6456 domain-containing protein [Hyphomicrobiales bacterium]|nr:DUF6456 domain-containing protein [Kaistiaceae bacterium]HQF30192.1 DUF6456 domain-containing protein [Hyphomicrobiales bacterium]
MSAAAASGDFDRRQAVRVLTALLGAGARAIAAGEHGYRTVGGNRPVRFPARLGEALRAAGLVVAGDGASLVASPAAAGFVRRAAAQDADPFRAQHQARALRTFEAAGEAADTVLVDEAESPLSWLRRRRGRDGRPLVGDAEFMAGERLRADYTRGGLMPRVTAAWDAAASGARRSGGRGGMAELTDAVVAARARVEKALGSVGPELSGVLVDVCCFLKGLEEVERERGWPARSAKVVLGLALARLAGHYGLSPMAEGPERGRMRRWGAEGYRPAIDGAG